MRNVAYRQYELGHGAMYQVEVEVPCPTCGELTPCTVYGADVVMEGPCVNQCDRESHFNRDELNDNAYAQAEQERRERAESYV